MKKIDKIIISPTAPKNTQVLWDNGKDLMIFRNGSWNKANKPMSEEILL